MKIALFAAVEEEVSKIKDRVHLTGIGRENATAAALDFMRAHQEEDFVIVNIGTAGAHTKPVGDILRITKIVSGGAAFLETPMLLHSLGVETDAEDAVLFSSDCFVSPRVYSHEFLKDLSVKADCFDMESSAVYSVARSFGKRFVSYKIVSDHLDVDLHEWQRRVHQLSDTLCDFFMDVVEELDKKDTVEFI